MPSFKVRVSSPDVRSTSGNRRNVFVDAPDEATARRLAAGMVGQGIVHDVAEVKPKRGKRPKDA